MADTMRILSRDAFAEVLREAQQRTRELDPSRWPLLRQVDAQLDYMARTTADGRVPYPEERARTTLGPLAARELEQLDPEFADQLEELDYTFHRYPLLPKGPPRVRRGILQVWTGRDAFRKLILEHGVPRTVGTARADFIVHADAAGSPQFQIVWDGVSAHVRAHDPHQLILDGAPGWYGELANRGWVKAGATTFRFLVEDRTPPRSPVTPTPASSAALAALRPRCDAGTLYAVVDAARSDRALVLVEESVDAHASLYDGEQGRAFDDVAPYLVQFRSDSGLLERLVHAGWGDAWGVFLQSDADFEAVRRHLRQFLVVKGEGEPRRLFFRFYDPRVMRTTVEVFTPEQRAELLKGLDGIYFEDADGRLRELR
ncbi:immunity protein Tsi6 family protein [Nannocystis punicea]|uniref:Immunity protein Tsi6 family protein n=1 Tax=Nannocystis punicea TaxID=2995304 RepID=A0ABY7HHP1_9BACT|nr:immunity protein Tsi6 family protein [Nannocystis poenicansa]WAS98846.1 immunity protein Tsi6 family protein [Nannocystis poenicansa]